jgi:hypothetical protein
MVESGRRTGFLLEPMQTVRISGKGGRQDVDGHVAAQPGIARTIDVAHPARREVRDDLVRTEECQVHYGQPCALMYRWSF